MPIIFFPVSGFMFAAEIYRILPFKALYCLKNKTDVIHCRSNIVFNMKQPKIDQKNKYRNIFWPVAQVFGIGKNERLKKNTFISMPKR